MADADIDSLTPLIASEIDATLRAHAHAHPDDAQHALTAGGIGSMLAGPLIKAIMAKLLPAIEAQAVSLAQAELAKLQAALPGLVAGLIEKIGGTPGAATPGADVGPGIV